MGTENAKNLKVSGRASGITAVHLKKKKKISSR
jgi:hypothetical protein